MIYWYPDLYMDEKVARQPNKCKRRVTSRRPWRKNYIAITLAMNEKNLFEIMGTRQLFFRRFTYLDLYVVGLASSQQEARKLLQKIVEDMWREDSSCHPQAYFKRDEFSEKIE